MSDERTVDGPATPAWQSLDPNVVPYLRRSGLIRIVMECLVVGVGSLIMYSEAWFTPAVRGVLLALGIAWIVVDAVLLVIVPQLHFRHAGYAVFDDRVEYREGAWWRNHYLVPRSRIQYFDVTQGPLERAFRLGRLHLHTAGTSDAVVTIYGLPHETASALRDELRGEGVGAGGV